MLASELREAVERSKQAFVKSNETALQTLIQADNIADVENALIDMYEAQEVANANIENALIELYEMGV